MKSALFICSLLLGSLALAETTTFQVKGMHCGGCKAAIEAKVCKMEGILSCKVELTNSKKQLGEVTLTSTDGKPVDALKVQEQLSEAGDYTILRTPKK